MSMERYLGDVGDIIGKIAIWRDSGGDGESGDGDSKYSTSPKGEEEAVFNSDQLMSILMVALASSVETAWRGSMDSFYLGQEGSEIEFGVLNAEMGLHRMDVWRCSVSLGRGT
ncbi:hypothetical protein Acr_10g0004270 [Actinidia rufa]|uniref:Uncharacterized protein n=1 Tax=Actinidia rufa TaxID=165716 RepID=A0A7J0F8L5_9ERIC|nr:hypothetical protein Acr_10g0004270 [Actinidia rufa]